MSSAPSLEHHTDSALGETLPLLASERQWSFIDIICIKSALVIASWAFLFGGSTVAAIQSGNSTVDKKMSVSRVGHPKADGRQTTQLRSFEPIEWNIKAAGQQTPQ
jgi:hypothetical protein